VGAGILVPLVRQADGGPAVIFLFYLRRLPVVLLPLLMPSLRQWFPFQEVHTRIPMSPLGINGLLLVGP
jgi:hypothetical protein